MIYNYLKIAVRNLRKYKFISFINLFGLTVGLTCCLLILTYILNELSFDTDAKTVMVNDKIVDLTRTEYDLLLYLVSNKNSVISKNAIAEHISRDEAGIFDNFDFIYAHMKNLKRKLSAAGSEDYIKAIYGMGYKFEI